MVLFIDNHREQYGVEPICTQLPIAPSTYYLHKARELDITKASERQQCDQFLMPHVQRGWEEDYRVYGARKIWQQLHLGELGVARCTVEWPMWQLSIQGIVRGKRRIT